MSSIWKENFNNDQLFLEIQSFFDHIKDSQYLQYRDNQRSMAYSVVDAIENKQILLIEAGVGIGKSYAYLIPLLQSIKDDEKFAGCIIATSTIALQEQLVKDVHKVAEMLHLDLKENQVILAKGKNNYICRKRLNDFLMTTGNEKYRYILDEVLKSESIDRKDFEEISNKMWQNFNVRVCSNISCPYYANCEITQERPNYKNAKIIITNQDLFIQDLKKEDNEELFNKNKVVVIDEAHNLEEKIRNSYVFAIDKRYVESLLYRLYISVSDYLENYLPPQFIFDELTEFFTRLRASAKNEIRKLDIELADYLDYNRIRFYYGSKLEQISKKLINSISTIIDTIEMKNQLGHYKIDEKALQELRCFQNILEDITLEQNSKNIYWVDFIDVHGKYLRLSYAPKKIEDYSAQLLTKIHAGVILTSATLSVGEDNYQYYSSMIGLDKVVGKTVLKDFSLDSSYDYENHTILYCPQDIASPKNKNEYLQDITERISSLIEITKGKTLVLFTSKSDMNFVYQNMEKEEFDFPIYIQKENSNMKKLKEIFENNINSCLFATGSFYEGIDIKGESLSQVIIARLPFPLVDPVMDYKANKYKDGFLQVYLPEMILKLRQGTGRAIRSEEDKAVISILDSRIYDYNARYDDMIFKSLPYSNITDDIDDVQRFVNQKMK